MQNLEQRRYDGAISEASKAIGFNPKLTTAYEVRGLAKGITEDYDGAIADFTNAIELDARNIPAYGSRGNLRFKKLDYNGAIADYSKAIALYPGIADERLLLPASYLMRGNARCASGDFAGAIADASKAIELSHDYSGNYYVRAWARNSQGDTAGALADVKKALAMTKPDSMEEADGRGMMAFFEGKYQIAIDWWGKAIQLNPTPLNGLELSCKLQPRLDKAKANLSK